MNEFLGFLSLKLKIYCRHYSASKINYVCVNIQLIIKVVMYIDLLLRTKNRHSTTQLN
jgi:hypothetical protein